RRLRPGEPISVSDGYGVVVHGAVEDVARGRLTMSVRDRVVTPRREPRFVVVQALAKGGRDEDALEAMTEVGVDEVVGWQSRRAVAKWTPRTRPRWEAAARAAAKQSRRAWLRLISGPVTTAEGAARLAD